jgi:predicted TIM-barrel fold metal-dependent hydrolase
MQRYDIQGGVVSHFGSVNGGPALGNPLALEAISGTGLWAGIVMVPEMFYQETQGRADLSRAIAGGARLARLYPRSHHFSLRPWCSGGLLQALADSHMPLMIPHTEVSWEDVRAVCETYPGLTLILEAVDQKILYHNRQFYPLLAHYPNLRLELHNFVAYQALEDVVGRFGARHLIFGSYMPIADPNAALMQVTHARISDEDKALIARQNLLELIKGVKPL